MAAVADDKNVNLFLGRSGNGKTSCVQTIIDIVNSDMILVECPDVGDTGADLQKDIDTVEKNTGMLVQELSSKYGGIVALVFVLKYGVRFTKQEKDAVAVVKYLFGDRVFRDRGIIAFTYGDLFDLDYGDTPDNTKSFMDWCREQTGDIEQLFQEVNYRCVLFDNKTKDVTENKKLVTLLSNHVLYIRLTQPKCQTLDICKSRESYETIYSTDDVMECFITCWSPVKECVRTFWTFLINVVHSFLTRVLRLI